MIISLPLMDSTRVREIIEHSRSHNIEDIFCLFGFKTNLLGLKQMKRSIQVSSSKTAMMGLRKITILSNLSHQIRMADNVCSKVLNVKSMKAQMRNIHGIGGA